MSRELQIGGGLVVAVLLLGGAFWVLRPTPMPEVPPQVEPVAKPVEATPGPGPVKQPEPEEKGYALGEAFLLLEDAGEEPRREVRYTAPVGSKETLELVIDSTVGQDMGGDPRITNAPPWKLVAKGAVAAVQPSGTIRFTFEVSDVGVLPEANPVDMSAEKKKEMEQVVAQVQHTIEGMRGAKGEVLVTAQGLQEAATITPPPGQDAKLFARVLTSLHHAATPFPTEPIGVGATWKVTEKVVQSGMRLTQTSRFSLKALDGNVAKVHVVIEQKGDAESFQMAALPEGTTASLVALASKGAGTREIHLDRVFPSGDLKHGFESRVLLTKNGQGMHVGTSEELDLSLKSL